MKRALVIALVLLATSGCRSDRTFLSNAAAEYLYQESLYERRCVNVAGPADCLPHQQDVKDAKAELVVADKVIAIGKIPKEERAAIKAAMAKVKAHR